MFDKQHIAVITCICATGNFLAVCSGANNRDPSTVVHNSAKFHGFKKFFHWCGTFAVKRLLAIPPHFKFGGIASNICDNVL